MDEKPINDWENKGETTWVEEVAVAVAYEI